METKLVTATIINTIFILLELFMNLVWKQSSLPSSMLLDEEMNKGKQQKGANMTQ